MDETLHKTAMDVAREMVEQPALFLEFDGVDGLSLPDAIFYPPRYTGERTTLDDAKMLRVGALRLLGLSDREIESACHVTRRSIPLLVAHLEKTGRITPLKDRLAAKTGQVAEQSAIVLGYLLDRVGQPGVGDGGTDLAAMIKAVATTLGISTEKVLLLTGQATQILETKSGAGREDFERWWKDSVTTLKPVDSQSPSFSEIPLQNVVIDEAGHELGTTAPAELPPKPTEPTTDAQPGGGDGPAPGTPNMPMS